MNWLFLWLDNLYRVHYICTKWKCSIRETRNGWDMSLIQFQILLLHQILNILNLGSMLAWGYNNKGCLICDHLNIVCKICYISGHFSRQMDYNLYQFSKEDWNAKRLFRRKIRVRSCQSHMILPLKQKFRAFLRFSIWIGLRVLTIRKPLFYTCNQIIEFFKLQNMLGLLFLFSQYELFYLLQVITFCWGGKILGYFISFGHRLIFMVLLFLFSWPRISASVGGFNTQPQVMKLRIMMLAKDLFTLVFKKKFTFNALFGGRKSLLCPYSGSHMWQLFFFKFMVSYTESVSATWCA